MFLELTAKLEALTFAAPTTFPRFDRLPPELRFKIWHEFLRNEAASRIVLVHGLVPKNPLQLEEDELTVPELRIMPLKRLISPLMMVSRESRVEALRHYQTRVDITSLAPIINAGGLSKWIAKNDFNAGTEQDEDLDGVRRLGFMNLRVREQWAMAVERMLCRVAREVLEDQKYNTPALREYCRPRKYFQPRGCIHLDMHSDRFLFVRNWTPPVPAPLLYGLRALSEGFDDFLDRRAAHVDVQKILETHCPPVLRNASAPLAPAVRQQIRHAVFPHYDTSVMRVCFEPNQVNGFPDAPDAEFLLGHDAFAAEGSLAAFEASEQMYRSFFDDVEEKGPECLGIRTAKLVDVEDVVMNEDDGFDDVIIQILKWEKDIVDADYNRL